MHDPLIDGVISRPQMRGIAARHRVVRNAALSIIPSVRPKEVNRVCCTANQTIGAYRAFRGHEKTLAPALEP
jgi:hypothetical protein